MRLAAIDIGSNAARLLITDAINTPEGTIVFNKVNLIRVPLRLGFDVFESGEISDQKKVMIMETMSAYRHLLNAYNVQHLKACATSAMRDAKNSATIITEVKNRTGIEINRIRIHSREHYSGSAGHRAGCPRATLPSLPLAGARQYFLAFSRPHLQEQRRLFSPDSPVSSSVDRDRRGAPFAGPPRVFGPVSSRARQKCWM